MELILKNFKSYKGEHNIQFEKKINLFFGINGAGKSNIIDAIYILSQSEDVLYEDYANNENVDEKDASIFISMKIEIKYSDLINEILEMLKHDFKLKGEECLEKIFNFLSSIILKTKNYFFISLEINKENINTKSINFLFNDSNLIQEKIDKFIESEEEKNPGINQKYNELISYLKNFINFNYNEYELLYSPKIEKWSHKSEYLILDKVSCKNEKEIKEKSIPLFNIINNYAKEEKQDILSRFESIQGSPTRRKSASEKITKFINTKLYNVWPGFKKQNLQIHINIVEDGIETHIKNCNQSNYKPLSVESDGIKRFLSMFFSVFINNKNNKIILIDEPEIHLHPGSIIELKNELIKTSKNNYLFIPTHSIQMLSRNTDEVSHYHIKFNETNLSSEIEKYYFEKNDIKKTLIDFFGSESLYYNYMFSRKVLFVEGISDMRILNQILSSYKIDILVLPTSGGQAHFIIDSYKNMLPNEYFLQNVYYLHDDDKGGEKNKNKIIENSILDSKKIINISTLGENLKVIESLFESEIFKKYEDDIKENKEIQKIKTEYTDNFISNYKEDNKYDSFIKLLTSKMEYSNE